MTKFKDGGEKQPVSADQLVVRLFSGEITEEEAQNIRKWRMGSEAQSEEFERSIEAWSRVEELGDDPEIKALCERATQHRQLRRLLASISGLATAAVVLWAVVFMFQSPPSWQDNKKTLLVYETVVGERREITLSDGSRIALNTNSRLIVDFNKKSRTTILDRGEAFFDVEKNLSRPFRVELGGKVITVLGTKFNVNRASGQGTEISVVEGVVAVHDQNDKILDAIPLLTVDKVNNSQLSASKQYRLEKGTVLVLGESNYSVSASFNKEIQSRNNWQEGYVRFEGQRLSDVVREMNRYTEKKIIVVDEQAKALEVNAVLQLDDIDLALDGVERVLPVNIERFANHTIIVFRGDEDQY